MCNVLFILLQFFLIHKKLCFITTDMDSRFDKTSAFWIRANVCSVHLYKERPIFNQYRYHLGGKYHIHTDALTLKRIVF